MKKHLLLLPLLFVLATGFAQKLKVPEAVANAFATRFPDATNVIWGKEDANIYEAEFKLNAIAMSANFAANGNWKETETRISITDLPAAVTNAVIAKYPDSKISIAEKVENPRKMHYELVLLIKNAKKEVELSSDGKFL